MQPTSSISQPWWVRVAIVAMLAAALFHGSGALQLMPLDWFPQYRTYPLSRHVAFICINLAGALYVRSRPLWALPLFIALLIQQSIGHGSKLIMMWQQYHRVDWISVAVLITLYVATAFIISESIYRLRSKSVKAL